MSPVKKSNANTRPVAAGCNKPLPNHMFLYA